MTCPECAGWADPAPCPYCEGEGYRDLLEAGVERLHDEESDILATQSVLVDSREARVAFDATDRDLAIVRAVRRCVEATLEEAVA